MNNNIVSEFGYSGKIEFGFYLNNKEVKSYHNNGTANLQKSFAYLMSGNTSSASKLTPRYLNIVDSTKSVAYIKNLISLTGSRALYESAWVAVHNASIDTANVNLPVTYTTQCYMQLVAQDGTSVLAEVLVNTADTVAMIDGNVSGSVKWIMKLNI